MGGHMASVCVCRERTIEWWSFKVALTCLCVAGTKLTAQLPLQALFFNPLIVTTRKIFKNIKKIVF